MNNDRRGERPAASPSRRQMSRSAPHTGSRGPTSFLHKSRPVSSRRIRSKEEQVRNPRPRRYARSVPRPPTLPSQEDAAPLETRSRVTEVNVSASKYPVGEFCECSVHWTLFTPLCVIARIIVGTVAEELGMSITRNTSAEW